LADSSEGVGRSEAPGVPGHGQIPALTGVRALAAFLVFFHHHPTDLLEVGPLKLWLEMHVGVSIFFVLSGFLITWRYDQRGAQKESFLRGYFVNRFARIYPLYFILVVLTMLIGRVHSLSAWLLNLTIFTNFEAGIAQAWSLRVEECFYLSAPLIYLGWRRNPALPLAAGAAVLAALYPFSKLPAAEGFLGPPHYLFLYTFFGRFFEFYVGIWLAKRVARSKLTAGSSGRLPFLTLTGIFGIAGIIVALADVYRTAQPKTHFYGVQYPAGLALNNLVLPLFIAAFFWGLIRERTLVRRILSSRAAGLLGRSSYAFYLIHMGSLLNYVLAGLVAVAGVFGIAAKAHAAALLGNVGVVFLLVTLLSIALYLGIESPANRFIRRRFGFASRTVAGRRPIDAAETG
jgi:peptidoglycan/LPS O-acetylase OafA/YrhL